MPTAARRNNCKRIVSQVVFDTRDRDLISTAGFKQQSEFDKPFIPSTWASAVHPTARPPTPVPVDCIPPLPPPSLRPSKAPSPRMTSSVVDSVFSKCKKIDPQCELASATFTHSGETLVRVRTSITCSITALKKAIDNTMPLCGTEVVDNPLDGTTEIGVIVSSRENEMRAAKNLSRKRPITRLIGHVGMMCFVFGAASWIVSLFEAAGSADAREL